MSANMFGRAGKGLLGLLLIAAAGCGGGRSDSARESEATRQLPPAYTRDKIVNPALREAARSFTTWVEAQASGDARAFLRAEILPPAPTLLPYGIGTYQKQSRLPAILITGPGWPRLSPAERETLAAQAFRELASRLEAAKAVPPVLPSVTIQTPQGLELAWINELERGVTLLHGEDD